MKGDHSETHREPAVTAMSQMRDEAAGPVNKSIAAYPVYALGMTFIFAISVAVQFYSWH